MQNKAKIIALAGTVLFHMIVLLTFLFSFITYPPDDMEDWTPEPVHEIVVEEVEDLYATGEFVRTGDLPVPAAPVDKPAPSDVTDPVPTQDAPDLENAGKPAQQPKVTTSERPSPAQVKKEKKGPTEEEIRKEKERQEAKRQQQAKKNVEAATNRAFGGDKGKGTPGAVEGNSATGEVTGTPGNGLKGRTMESWTSVRGKKLGTIAIRVKVDASGRVVSATYSASGSSGTVAADQAMRQQCIARSKECRFSVLEGSPVQTGTITWVFK